MNENDLEILKVATDTTTKIIGDTKTLRQYFNKMGDLALGDIADRKLLYQHAIVVGYSRAMFDIMTGRLDLKLISIDKGEPNETTEPDNDRFNRN